MSDAFETLSAITFAPAFMDFPQRMSLSTGGKEMRIARYKNSAIAKSSRAIIRGGIRRRFQFSVHLLRGEQ